MIFLSESGVWALKYPRRSLLVGSSNRLNNYSFGVKNCINYILCVPCQAASGMPASFASPLHRWVVGLLKKTKRAIPNKKTLFLPQRRSEMILTSRPPVNFASNILGLKKTLEAKFYNGLQKKYKEQLVFNSKIITR
jgi:hypothetical protein